MDYLQKFTSQFRDRLVGLLVLNNLIILTDWWLADHIFKLAGPWLVIALVGIPLLSLTILPWLSVRYLIEPTRLLWQAILHILPDSQDVPAPNLNQGGFGTELVTHMVNQVYQLAIEGARLSAHDEKEASDLHKSYIAAKLPMPLLVIDAHGQINYANGAALQYFGMPETELAGKDFYTQLSLAFPSTDTLDSWLKHARTGGVNATNMWQHVRLTLPSKKVLQFDLSASYSKDDVQDHELMLAFFDRTAVYEQDDQSLSFIGLAVHELRTPLSMLLGYIEVFEQELNGKLDPELTRFMFQMKTAGQNLATFVSKILTVVRIESNQLELELTEQRWDAIVNQAVEDMRLRAQLQGLTLETYFADDLPTVGVNPITASEVIINLIDNAIKYSKEANPKKIIITTKLNASELVETTIQDHGVGIPASIIPHLFEKFYRNHRTRTQIGGTGLGLYLCRLIVDAHGGNIWVQSKEGQGATFGFTVKPYAALASELKNSNNTDIVHSAHGWIKNHSLYRS